MLNRGTCVAPEGAAGPHEPCPAQGTLVYTLQEVKPTIFLGVPPVWEKMQETIKENVSRSSSLRKKAFAWAKILGLKVNTKRMLG